jgi:hypothetical protein
MDTGIWLEQITFQLVLSQKIPDVYGYTRRFETVIQHCNCQVALNSDCILMEWYLQHWLFPRKIKYLLLRCAFKWTTLHLLQSVNRSPELSLSFGLLNYNFYAFKSQNQVLKTLREDFINLVAFEKRKGKLPIPFNQHLKMKIWRSLLAFSLFCQWFSRVKPSASELCSKGKRN